MFIQRAIVTNDHLNVGSRVLSPGNALANSLRNPLAVSHVYRQIHIEDQKAFNNNTITHVK
jgi:hypothetical protein